MAVAVGLPLLWLDYAVHGERHRIFVEYLHRTAAKRRWMALPNRPCGRSTSDDRLGVLTVLPEDRRVRLGLWTPFGDSRLRSPGNCASGAITMPAWSPTRTSGTSG